MKTRTLRWVPGGCASVLYAAIVAVLANSAAFAETTMTMARSVTGLDAGGWLIPGTTTLDFTVTLTLGGDMERVTALGIAETLPAGWSFEGTITGSVPDIIEVLGPPRTIDFVWWNIPSFPCQFTYRVNVPAGELGPVNIVGYAIFRTGGPQLFSNEVTTAIAKSPTITVAREFAGTTGPGGAYCEPGSQIDVTLNFDWTAGSADLTEFTFKDTLPSGWEYVPGSFSGVPAPVSMSWGPWNVEFAWRHLIPTFPFSFTYSVHVPDWAEGEACLDGVAKYRIAGNEEQSNTMHDCLNQPPYLYMTHTAPSNYAGMSQFDVTLCVRRACATTVWALGITETLPPGLSFVSANPAPPVLPAVGATGTLEFAWIAVPSFPLAFTYTLAVEPGLEDDLEICGQAVYRLDGEELRSPETCASLIYAALPVITLLGSDPVTVQCGATYTDAGAAATSGIGLDLTGQIVVDNPVDTAAPGAYTVRYNVTDGWGQPAVEVTRTVIVVDIWPPVITLVGNPLETVVQCGGPFVDPGVTATDACDGDLTSRITTVNPVNPKVPGYYLVTYSVSDAAGNEAIAARNVVVADTQAATITLIGDARVTVECDGNYADAGATAMDACDGDLTDQITTTGLPIDTAVTGQYTVTYRVTDSQGYVTQASRVVTVEDTVRPVITLLDNADVTVECGGSYQDAGVTALDICQGDLTASVAVGGDSVDTGAPGIYQITYTVFDGAGNAALPANRTVTVADTQAPVITLLGDNPYTVPCNQDYVDLGAEAFDACDTMLPPVAVDASMIDTADAGTYEVQYAVADASGNEGVATRMVIVEGPCEGEGETPCELNEVIIIEPAGDIVVPPGVRATVTLKSRIAFADPAYCQDARVEVVYEIDGIPVASSQDQAEDFPAVVDLAVGEYTLDAIATNLDTGGVTAGALQFQVRAGIDSDANGYLDSPFAELVQDGDRWECVVSDGANLRAVAMQTWFGACEGQNDGTFSVTVAGPEDPNQTVTVTAPRALLACNEQGVLVLSAAATLDALLGAPLAAWLPQEPATPTAGGIPFEISILITRDNGATFAEVDNSLLEAYPLRIVENGLAFTPGYEETFFSYPTAIRSDPATGIEVTLEEGVWSREAVRNIAVQGGTLSAEVNALSLFLPIERSTTGPTLSVLPDPKHAFIADSVQVGASKEFVLTLRNIGGGVVNGTAIIADPNGFFCVVGDTTYSLETNMTTDIVVRFTPMAVGVFNAALTLSNAAGDPVTVTLNGAGTASPKPSSTLGCHAGVPSRNAAGDVATLIGATAILFVISRRRYRA